MSHLCISGAETLAKMKVTPILLFSAMEKRALGGGVFVSLPNWMKISKSSSPDAASLALGTRQPSVEEVNS